MKTKTTTASRRRFLAGLGSGLAALGLFPKPRARAAPDPGRTNGFRRTAHVETYYRTLED